MWLLYEQTEVSDAQKIQYMSEAEKTSQSSAAQGNGFLGVLTPGKHEADREIVRCCIGTDLTKGIF